MEKPKFTINGWSFYKSGIQYEPQQYFISYKQLLDDLDNEDTFLRHVSQKSWSSVKMFWPVYFKFLQMHNIGISRQLHHQYQRALEIEQDELKAQFLLDFYLWETGQKPFILASDLKDIDSVAEKWADQKYENTGPH